MRKKKKCVRGKLISNETQIRRAALVSLHLSSVLRSSLKKKRRREGDNNMKYFSMKL